MILIWFQTQTLYFRKVCYKSNIFLNNILISFQKLYVIFSSFELSAATTYCFTILLVLSIDIHYNSLRTSTYTITKFCSWIIKFCYTKLVKIYYFSPVWKFGPMAATDDFTHISLNFIFSVFRTINKLSYHAHAKFLEVWLFRSRFMYLSFVFVSIDGEPVHTIANQITRTCLLSGRNNPCYRLRRILYKSFKRMVMYTSDFI